MCCFGSTSVGLNPGMGIFSFLYRPYSFSDDLKRNARFILWVSLGMIVFLLLFQPIGIEGLLPKQVFYLFSGFVICTFMLLSLNLLVLPSVLPAMFSGKRWNVLKEILWNIWLAITLAAADLLVYNKVTGTRDLEFFEIGRILLLGCIPVTILIIVNQDRFFRNYIKNAQDHIRSLVDKKSELETLIHFDSDYKKDKLSILPDSLLLIKAADNYINVFYRSKEGVKNQLIRSSLVKACDTVEAFDFIFRCHRTFIVNIHHVKEIDGNSQGYKLFFDDIDFPALVSQKYMEKFKEKM